PRNALCGADANAHPPRNRGARLGRHLRRWLPRVSPRARPLPRDRVTAVHQPPVVECVNVSKKFYLYEHRTSSLQEFFVRSVLRRPIHVRHARFQVTDFNLSVSRGEAWGLVGANGSGKSTVLRLIAGIYPPTSGTIV